jgi:nucleoside-diphosphate-sugar epimerase
LVSDGHDVSTPELLKEIGAAMGRQPLLLPVPVKALEAVARFTQLHATFVQLCGSLQVDISETRKQLDWAPRVDFTEGVRRTVQWYLNERRTASSELG